MTSLAVIMCILGSVGAIMFIFVIFLSNMVLGGGCLSTLIGLGLLGGYGGLNFFIWEGFGAPGMVILNIVGIILGIIAIKIIKSDSSSSSSYSSSSGPSTSASMRNWAESRKNDPHTCGNCVKYSSVKGECRLSGNHKSAEDSCSNWD